MNEQNLEKLLKKLGEDRVEPADTALAENIKRYIPNKLSPHRLSMDTINIFIDLRISKLAAAAIILITMGLCFAFLGSSNFAGDGIFQDGKVLARYWFRGDVVNKENLLAGITETYEYLLGRKEDVVYYEKSFNSNDSSAILMHWKHAEGKYKVIFADLHIKTVSAEELIDLQSRMLLKK